MPPLNLLIKPASGLCNMRCTYCFYCDEMKNREQASYGIMSEATQEAVIQKALEYAEVRCTLAYQGGEPTLAGLDYFRRSIELQKKYNTKGLKIDNAIQTNGYAMDDEWAAFFAENHFLVGFSLDGTKKTHDAYRLDMAGQGTFERVLKAAAIMDRHHVEYNILTVVNARTARQISHIYPFYKKSGFRYLQFIPCLEPLDGGAPSEFALTPQAYGVFLNTLFDLWYNDLMRGEEISVRTFDNYVQMLMGMPPESCGMGGICTSQNVVESDGGVYPCDFYVLDDYRLGNLNECGFAAIEEKRKELQFVEASVEKDKDCTRCQYFFLCRGGCKRYREPFLNGNYQRDCFCEAYKAFFGASLPRLQELANRMRWG